MNLNSSQDCEKSRTPASLLRNCSDKHSQRIQQEARVNFGGFVEMLRRRLEQAALRYERSSGETDWFPIEHQTAHRKVIDMKLSALSM
jgi:hypothetical protein